MTERLCKCSQAGCKWETYKLPIPGFSVSGRLLPRREWAKHRKAQREADAVAEMRQVALLGKMTIMHTIDMARNLPSEKETDNEELLLLSSVLILLIWPFLIRFIGNQDDDAPSQSPSNLPELRKNAVSDILYSERTVGQRVASFSWPRQLKFRLNPSDGTSFVTEFTLSHPSNRGKCGLDPEGHCSETSRLYNFENWLIEAYMAIEEIDTFKDKTLVSSKKKAMGLVIQALCRVDNFKKDAWESCYITHCRQIVWPKMLSLFTRVHLNNLFEYISFKHLLTNKIFSDEQIARMETLYLVISSCLCGVLKVTPTPRREIGLEQNFCLAALQCLENVHRELRIKKMTAEKRAGGEKETSSDHHDGLAPGCCAFSGHRIHWCRAQFHVKIFSYIYIL